MSYLIAPVALYSAFVLHIALRFGASAMWAPNLTLLVGLLAARQRGGLAWAAVAGLLCDGLSSRPLGVTMLVATLVATTLRHLFPKRPAIASRQGVVEVFAAVAVIEAASRVLAGTVLATPDHAGQAVAALRIAASTAGVAIVLAAIVRGSGRFQTAVARGPAPGGRLSMRH